MNLLTKKLGVLFFALTLSACGSGGGDSAPPLDDGDPDDGGTTPTSELDTTFGVSGKSLNLSDFTVVKSIVNADGKIVVAGKVTNLSFNPEFAIMQFNSDGTLDTEFGTSDTLDGTSVTPIHNTGFIFDSPAAILIQDDSKIIVGGNVSDGSEAAYALVRYNADGTLDETFGDDGKVLDSTISNNHDYLKSMVLQPDGKIVASGRSNGGGSGLYYGFSIARFNIDGSLDTSFGTNGKTNTVISSSNYYGNNMAMLDDGSFLVVGTGPDGLDVAKYTDAGLLDTAFGTSGIAGIAVGGTVLDEVKVKVETDGTIVLATSCQIASETKACIAKLDATGAAVGTFGTNGVLSVYVTTYNPNTAFYLDLYDVAFLSNGKIAVGAVNDNGATNNDFVIALFNSDGTVDTSFAGTGFESTDLGLTLSEDYLQNIVEQEPGKLIAIGHSYSVSNLDDDYLSLTRYNY